MACRAADLSIQDGKVTLTALCPKTLEAPIGFSLLPVHPTSQPMTLFAPAVPVGDYSKTHQVTGTLDWNDLPVDPDSPYWLTCVLGMEGDIPLHAPLTLTEGSGAVAVAEQAEGHPVVTQDGWHCYLYCGTEHRPLDWPGGSCPRRSCLRQNRLTQALPVQWQTQPGCFARHKGGHDWQWELEVPGRDFNDAQELLLCLIHEKGTAKVFCPVTVTGSSGHGCLLRADLTLLQQQVESCRRTNWQAVLLARQNGTCYVLRLLDPTRPPVRSKRKQTTFNFFGSNYDNPIGQMPLRRSHGRGRPLLHPPGQLAGRRG